MTRFDVFATIAGLEEKILENYSAESESDAKKAGRLWLRMNGRTPAKSRLTKTEQTRATIRVVDVSPLPP